MKAVVFDLWDTLVEFPAREAEALKERLAALTTVDPDGVALAAIQGLNQKLEQKQTEITELKQRVEKLETLLNEKLIGGAK